MANPEGYKFIVIGDYGFSNTTGQWLVAEKMEEIASIEQINFILGTGDNFYDPDGVTGVNDPNWDTHWRLIY